VAFDQDPFGQAGAAGAVHVPAARTAARLLGTQTQARHRGATHSLAPGTTGVPHPHHTAVHRAASSTTRRTVQPGDHRSRLTLRARAGLQEIEVGTIAAYDAATNTALVRLVGAQANLIGPLPLTQGLSPALAVAGASCLVVLLDTANPADAAIVALYNAPPGIWVQAGSVALPLTGYQAAQSVVFPLAFTGSVLAVTGCSRDPAFVATVSGEDTGGFVLTLTRVGGAEQTQAGLVQAPVAAGSAGGSATITFPLPFAVARTVLATAAAAGWVAGVSGAPTATGCEVTVSSLNGPAATPVTVTVYWQAGGDAAVDATVEVDWVAVGT
jgi:hypothetical protein